MFITFEGGEGGGKTTAIKAVTKLLKEHDCKLSFYLSDCGLTANVDFTVHNGINI